MVREGNAPSRLAPQMTDAEALMWSVEKDPWFASTIGTILLCEGSVDARRFRRRLAAAVADLPRLRERVVPGGGRFAAPTWGADPEFELDYHVREISLPRPGDRRQLLELAARLLQDPFDRTRPLWQFWIVDGVAHPDGQAPPAGKGRKGAGKGRTKTDGPAAGTDPCASAVIIKLHHTITDGQGGVRLAERYMDLGADGPLPPEVDLDAIVAAAAEEGAADHAAQGPHAAASAAASVGHAARRQFGIARRLAAETALTMADPRRVPELLERVGGDVRSLVGQLAPGESDSHSPLWRRRSRKRRLDVLTLPFAPAKAAAGALGGSLNDFFVTGAVGGAGRYHQARGVSIDALTVTFIVSTRTDRSEGGNAFSPSKAVLPAAPMPAAERFEAVHRVLGDRRHEVSGDGLLAGFAGVANLLPTSVATRLARAQAGNVDFATSNVRAAPFEVYVGGARVLASYPVGPVAGTAWNVTLMSYAGRLHLGVHLDPVAVSDPELLLTSLAAAYEELFEAGGAPTHVSAGTW